MSCAQRKHYPGLLAALIAFRTSPYYYRVGVSETGKNCALAESESVLCVSVCVRCVRNATTGGSVQLYIAMIVGNHFVVHVTRSYTAKEVNLVTNTIDRACKASP